MELHSQQFRWRMKYTHLIFVPVSQPLRDLMMGVSSLEASAIQINSTHSILQFEISGTQYTSTAVATKTIVQCFDGQERNDILCSKIYPQSQLVVHVR